jgi:hypothetical protein
VRRYWDKEYAIEIYQKPIQKVGEKIPSSRLSNSVHRKAGTLHVVILIYNVHRTVKNFLYTALLLIGTSGCLLACTPESITWRI